MRALATEEMALLVDELRSLAGFYIDKFYEVHENRFRIRISRKGEQANLLVMPGKTVNRTEYIEKNETPSNFSKAVRNRIEGFRIEGVELVNGDRIIGLRLAKGEAREELIVEMFGKGNLVLADGDRKILAVYRPHDFSDRSVRVGAAYETPRRNAAPEREERHGAAGPAIHYGGGGEVVGFTVFEGGAKPEGTARSEAYGSVEALLDSLYHKDIGAIQEDGEGRRETEELKASIRKQEELESSLAVEIEENRKRGEWLMRNMGGVNRAIAMAQEDKKAGAEELGAGAAGFRIAKVDRKEKRLIIDVQE